MPDQRLVQVITDSTADIPAELLETCDIVVVPLSVSFGSTSYVDGVDISPMRFVKLLREADTLPTTSQPPVPDFEAAFQKVLDAGKDVVCVTVSGDLSGTFNSARLAAEAMDTDRVMVIDSRGASMQIGWVAIAAARIAQTGGSLAEVAAEATAAIPRSKLYAVLQTLEYVHKGGRIGRAQHIFGSALAIKPIIAFNDGVVDPIERVRTWKKAVARATDLIIPTPTDIVVLHSDNLPDAERIAQTLRDRYPATSIGIGQAGPVITTYAGPGAIATTALYPPT